MTSKSVSAFTSADLSSVVAVWQEHLRQYNDRMIIMPKNAGGLFGFLTKARQLQAQIFPAADGGTLLNLVYRQSRIMSDLFAEHGVVLPPKATIVGKGSNSGASVQVGVIRIPPQVPVETILTFVLQALGALSEKPIGEVFTANAERMRDTPQMHG